MAERPLTILCVSSYEKARNFCARASASAAACFCSLWKKLRNGDWPREAIDEMFFMPEDLPLSGLINAVSFTARNQKIDRIVALDEFDMENVSALREHLRIPGMGLTSVRYFRDKLANARESQRRRRLGAGICSCAQPRGTPRVHGACSRSMAIKNRARKLPASG